MKNVFNIRLAYRFVDDYKLPVAICVDESNFMYELSLYENDFNALSLWNKLNDYIDTEFNGDSDMFLEKYLKIREDIIQYIHNHPNFQKFVDDKTNLHNYNKVGSIKNPVSKSIYNQENIGKSFISIDMKNANFQMMQLIGVIEEPTYFDFISRFCDGYMAEYIASSKYTRQVIFGQACPKKTIALEKSKVIDLYNHIIYNNYDSELVCINSDEIIITVSDNDNENEMFTNLVQAIETVSSTDIKYRVEKFTLSGYEYHVQSGDGKLHKLGEFYKRSCDANGKYKGIPLTYHKILYKLLKNTELNDVDKIIMHEKCKVMLLDDIIVNEINHN